MFAGLVLCYCVAAHYHSNLSLNNKKCIDHFLERAAKRNCDGLNQGLPYFPALRVITRSAVWEGFKLFDQEEVKHEMKNFGNDLFITESHFAHGLPREC